MGGGELTNYQLTRQVDITPIIKSESFISLFKNSDYYNDTNIYKLYGYLLGYTYDMPYKRVLYDSFVTTYKTQLDNNEFISFNTLAAFCVDANYNLGPNFNLQSVTSLEELQKKGVDGANGRFVYGNIAMSGYERVTKYYNLDNNAFNKLFYYATYLGCNVEPPSVDQNNWSRFRGYVRGLYLLVNCLKYIGHDFSKCVRTKLISWDEAGITKHNYIGSLDFSQYLC